MQTCIALLRSINVSGKNKLPMNDLQELLHASGFASVETYIQSGNVVFEVDNSNKAAVTDQIKIAIRQQFGFEPEVLVLTKEQFLKAIKANPYPEVEGDTNTLHLFFLFEPAFDPDLGKLNELKKATERFTLTDAVLYLHAPDGIGRSKLASQAEKAIGVSVTARNWRTCQQLKAMVERRH